MTAKKQDTSPCNESSLPTAVQNSGMNDKPRSLSLRLAWIVAATSFSFVVVQLDVTIVNVALPRIGEELHAGIDTLQWIVDAYTLVFAVLLLSAGVLGD